MRPGVWTVVLAAGAGRRLADVTGGVPKQFWSPDGTRSLLDDTLARLSPIAPPTRTVVIVDEAHRRFVGRAIRLRPGTTVLFQPRDRGTAAGVLLALTPVLDAAPDAAVVITPSDHGVADARRYRRDIQHAVAYVRSRPEAIVLFGVEPTTPSEDYGWITPGSGAPREWARPVTSFVEKPTRETAQQLMASGALWNTMVVVARARTLFDLYREHLPGLATVFAEALELPAPEREMFLSMQYPELPALDFSRHLLTQARGLETYAWPGTIGWSDLGTPERLRRWLAAAAPVRTAHATTAA